MIVGCGEKNRCGRQTKSCGKSPYFQVNHVCRWSIFRSYVSLLEGNGDVMMWIMIWMNLIMTNWMVIFLTIQSCWKYMMVIYGHFQELLSKKCMDSYGSFSRIHIKLCTKRWRKNMFRYMIVEPVETQLSLIAEFYWIGLVRLYCKYVLSQTIWWN